MAGQRLQRPLALLAAGAAVGTVLARELGLTAQIATLLLFAAARVLLGRGHGLRHVLLGLCLGALGSGTKWAPVAEAAEELPEQSGPLVRVRAIAEAGFRWDSAAREWTGTVLAGARRFRLRWIGAPEPVLPG